MNKVKFMDTFCGIVVFCGMESVNVERCVKCCKSPLLGIYVSRKFVLAAGHDRLLSR